MSTILNYFTPKMALSYEQYDKEPPEPLPLLKSKILSEIPSEDDQKNPHLFPEGHIREKYTYIKNKYLYLHDPDITKCERLRYGLIAIITSIAIACLGVYIATAVGVTYTAVKVAIFISIFCPLFFKCTPIDRMKKIAFYKWRFTKCAILVKKPESRYATAVARTRINVASMLNTTVSVIDYATRTIIGFSPVAISNALSNAAGAFVWLAQGKLRLAAAQFCLAVGIFTNNTVAVARHTKALSKDVRNSIKEDNFFKNKSIN